VVQWQITRLKKHVRSRTHVGGGGEDWTTLKKKCIRLTHLFTGWSNPSPHPLLQEKCAHFLFIWQGFVCTTLWSPSLACTRMSSIRLFTFLTRRSRHPGIVWIRFWDECQTPKCCQPKRGIFWRILIQLKRVCFPFSSYSSLSLHWYVDTGICCKRIEKETGSEKGNIRNKRRMRDKTERETNRERERDRTWKRYSDRKTWGEGEREEIRQWQRVRKRYVGWEQERPKEQARSRPRDSSCWGYSLINTLKLKKKETLTLTEIWRHTDTERKKIRERVSERER